MRRISRLFAIPLCLVAVARADDAQKIACGNDSQFQHGAVVCVSQVASEVGAESLKRGGTAIDAAIATAFALAVTYPAAGNIGGGGYMLIVPAGRGESTVIDFREVAPAAATRDMFVDPSARTAHRRVGVPGTVRGLALAHSRHGRLAWRELILPAVKLARDGFALDAAVAGELNKVLGRSDREQFAELHRVYARPDTVAWQPGDRLVQPELARVLEIIANKGPDGFYQGEVAQLIASEMERGGGLVTTNDLEAYQPIARKPLRSTYRDCEILSVPPSSSGGTTLALALNMLENFEPNPSARWSATSQHRMAECMRRAYRERAAYLGDPATTDIPAELMEKSYARRLAGSIDPAKATPSEQLAGELPVTNESEHTTHVSVMDGDGTAVSMTYTLEQAFGSRVVVRGGGFLLNDEMNDFNWLPGVTNNKGRIGTLPNQIAPGKRMLSSMCPVVVRRDGRTLLVTGSPGGRTIVNTVLCVLVNVIDYRMDARAAVDAPRLHHAWFPDEIRIEPSLAKQHPMAVDELRRLGHKILPSRESQGDAHTLAVDPRSRAITAVPDHRVSGGAAGH
ncbi:MAG TPA: gamma-glutamyltransferase [Pirellulales bacterium]|jgi:gamma-glutamyltranspeptidase/glutathione hydrolase|nr:gamma-glutamyltransferase [Pirellulales bacterium]